MQVLAAACGVGTTIAFGTPVGGVLFSIEVTSSFYLVDSLWRGFFVAVCAESVFVISHRLGTETEEDLHSSLSTYLFTGT
jgi:H+/Cl- antiporter ClcA